MKNLSDTIEPMLSTYRDVPYVGNPGSACALACYIMVTKYFFPETTFEEVAEVSRWKKGYVVWEMPFWNWIMGKDIQVTNYDLIDYKAWAKKGVEGLKNSVPETEFEYYMENTFDLNSYTEDIKKVVSNPCFTHYRRNPEWSDLTGHFKSGAICTVVLNSAALDNGEEFELHQVVVLNITDTHITFHDPRGKEKERPKREETLDHFQYAWLKRVNAPSLSAYAKT